MDAAEAGKLLGELWSRSARSFLEAAGASAADRGSAEAAQAAFLRALAAAQSASSGFASRLAGQGTGGADPLTADILAKIFDPQGWLGGTGRLDEAPTRMADGPRLADLWNVERKFAAVLSAWAALRRRQLDHDTVMLDAWTRATGAFAEAVNERAEAGTPLSSARELMTLWTETANDALLETQRSEPFLKSQREVLKASTDLRLAQQDLGAVYADMLGYPTRAEIDDLHRGLTELRREVRAGRRSKRVRKPAPEPAPDEGAAKGGAPRSAKMKAKPGAAA